MNPHTQSYLSLIDDVIQYIKERPEEVLYSSAPASFSAPLPSLRKEIATLQPLAQVAPLLAEKEKKAPLPPPKVEEVVKVAPPKPTPPKEEIKAAAPKEEKKGALFALEPLKDSPSLPVEPLRKKLLEIDPALPLHIKPPDDIKARKIKEEWREKREIPPIPILAHTTRYLPFLKNVAKAISASFFPCRVLEIASFEKEKKWDLFFSSAHVSLVILSDQTLWESKELLLNYKENPQKKERFLASFPLLLLPDLSLYEKDPYLKRSLWNLLCQTIEKIKK